MSLGTAHRTARANPELRGGAPGAASPHRPVEQSERDPEQDVPGEHGDRRLRVVPPAQWRRGVIRGPDPLDPIPGYGVHAGGVERDSAGEILTIGQLARRTGVGVELIYSPDCPHIGAARAQLLRAFAESGMPPRWQEWRADDPGAPAHARGAGSPSILIDGRDVSGAGPAASEAASCRIYRDADGRTAGVPPLAAITAALEAAGAPTRRGDLAGRRTRAFTRLSERRRMR
jgi:hypothetical protein